MRLDGKSKLFVATATPDELEKYPMLVGNAAIVSARVLNEGWLTSAVVEELDEVMILNPLKPGDLEAFSGFHEYAFDSRGIVPVGAKVKFGTPLVVGFSNSMSLTVEQKLLKAIFGQAERGFPEILITSTLLDEAIVVRAETKGGGGGPLVVQIDLLVKRPISLGDVLDDGYGNHLVVACVADKDQFSSRRGKVDVLVHPATKLRLMETEGKRVVRSVSALSFTKATQQREQKLTARSIGLYSRLTQIPMADFFAGQKVNASFVATHGYACNVREMFTVKSDAMRERRIAYEALITGEVVPSTGVSEADTRFFRLLQACGFTATLGNGEINLSRTQDEKIKEWSHGEVLAPDTLNYKTGEPTKDGLMSQAVFGPVSDYQCACGKYRRKKYEGKVCEACGVEITLSSVRRARFGHITLAAPVIHPWFVALLSSTLAMTEKHIRAVLSYKENIEVSGAPFTGTEAIIGLLKERGIDPSPFVIGVLPVLPPELRPMYPIGNNRFASSDLNDLYRRIINRNSRLEALLKGDGPDVIIKNQKVMLQEIVWGLFMNTRFKGTSNRTLRGLDTEIRSLIENFFGKRTDYSAQAVCVPDPSLVPGVLGVPDAILIELFKPMIYRVLREQGIVTTVKSARDLVNASPDAAEVLAALDEAVLSYPLLAISESTVAGFDIARRQGEAIHLHPADAQKLGITFSGEHIQIHVPLSEEAKQEALSSPRPRNDMQSTFSLLTPAKIVEHVLAKEPFQLGNLDQLVFTVK